MGLKALLTIRAAAAESVTEPIRSPQNHQNARWSAWMSLPIWACLLVTARHGGCPWEGW
jgi:hypothetical protein